MLAVHVIISLVIIRNSKGPIWDPWGTAECASKVNWKILPPTFNRYFLLVIKPIITISNDFGIENWYSFAARTQDCMINSVECTTEFKIEDINLISFRRIWVHELSNLIWVCQKLFSSHCYRQIVQSIYQIDPKNFDWIWLSYVFVSNSTITHYFF